MEQHILFAVALLILQHTATGLEDDAVCKEFTNTSRSVRLSVKGWKNETGKWVTTFSAWKDTKIPSSIISVDVSQKVIECSGKEVIVMEGAVNDVSFESSNQKLRFHPNCGKNAAISNDGRSVEKLNLNDAFNGVVLTSIPLKNNELFEVRLDKKNTKFKFSMGIGITSYSPEGFNIPEHMYNLKSGNWMYYFANYYKDNVQIKENYGRNLNDLVVGDRVGVLRNNYGTLHFFVNGVDQGPAASNVPYPVYGVFELYYDAAKGTIVGN